MDKATARDIRGIFEEPDSTSSIMKLAIAVFAVVVSAALAQMPGGVTDYTPKATDPEVVFALSEINSYKQELGDNAQRTLIEIVSGKKQVVSGMKYTLVLKITGGEKDEMCNLEILEQAWNKASPYSTLTGKCNDLDGTGKPAERSAVGTPNAYNPALDSREVTAALASINSMYLTNGDNNARTAVEVVSATQQIVRGVKYVIKLKVTGGDNDEVCTVAMVVEPWLGSRQLVDNTPSCSPAVPEERRQLLGAPEEVTMNEDGVAEALDILERKVNERMNEIFYHDAGRPAKITKQVVNGFKFVFTNVPFRKTSCLRADGVLQADRVCTGTGLPKRTCSAEVIVPAGTVSNIVCSSKTRFL